MAIKETLKQLLDKFKENMKDIKKIDITKELQKTADELKELTRKNKQNE